MSLGCDVERGSSQGRGTRLSHYRMFNIKNASFYSDGKSEDRALEVKTPGLSSSSAEMNLASDRVLEM